MLAKKLLPLLLTVAASAAFAQEASPAASVLQRSTLTRAEVVADTQIWRQSGLAALQAGEVGSDPYSHRYLLAQAEYKRLRAAPQFAALVQRIAAERGEVVNVAAR